MTLSQLRQHMTYEELAIWIAYFNVLSEEQEEQLKKAKRSRR